MNNINSVTIDSTIERSTHTQKRTEICTKMRGDEQYSGFYIIDG